MNIVLSIGLLVIVIGFALIVVLDCFMKNRLRNEKVFFEAPKRIMKNGLGQYRIEYKVFGRWYPYRVRKLEKIVYNFYWEDVWFDSKQEAEKKLQAFIKKYHKQQKQELKDKIRRVKSNHWISV